MTLLTDDEYGERVPTLLADYEALGRIPAWRPYLMFFHAPAFRSASVNTDAEGFRLGRFPDGRVASVASAADEPCSLLVGNSVSFGVGASSDDATVAARLSARTGTLWHNFGGRAYGGLQEWLLFHGYADRIGPIDRVVLFSGLNDLILHYVPRDADPVFGVAFYGNRFRTAMNAQTGPRAEDASGRVLARALGRRVTDRVTRRAAPPQPPGDVEADVRAREPSREAIVARLERQLGVWKAVADARGFRLAYVLQPLWPWLTRTAPPVEQESVRAYDGRSRWHALVRAVIDEEHRAWYVPRLEAICVRLGIPFTDLGAVLSEQADDGSWLFLDRIHLTDRGQNRAAELIAGL